MASAFFTDARSVTLSGLWVAGIGFFVTRFTVTLAAFENQTQFLFAGIVPLVLGLLLATFGIALVIGSFEPRYVRTVALWCGVGALGMCFFVLLTLVGASPDGIVSLQAIRSRTYLANFLIGGSIGGTLTGVYAAQTKRHRTELKRQANRLVTLNRMLRHDVLNAISVISGSAKVLRDETDPLGADERVDTILQRTGHVAETIDDVRYITEVSQDDLESVDLLTCVEETLEKARNRHANASFIGPNHSPPEVEVWADANLKVVLLSVLDNAAQHTEETTPAVEVAVEVGPKNACVRIVDNGPGLPSDQQAILERGEITEHDDAASGFGLNIVRLLVEQYRGEIRTDVTDDGTEIELVLTRADQGPRPRSEPGDVRSYGIQPWKVMVAVCASIAAGVMMGVLIQWRAGVVPVIGALYGVPNPFVGWITHLFHSVVFGMVFAGLLVVVPTRFSDTMSGRLAVGAGWAIFLWLFAAGVVMPIWLRLLGMGAPIPNLTSASFIGHLVWGASLALFYHFGVTRNTTNAMSSSSPVES